MGRPLPPPPTPPHQPMTTPHAQPKHSRQPLRAYSRHRPEIVQSIGQPGALGDARRSSSPLSCWLAIRDRSWPTRFVGPLPGRRNGPDQGYERKTSVCRPSPISSATAEATVNLVIAARMVKKQQMRWSPLARTGCSKSAPASSTTNSTTTSTAGTRASRPRPSPSPRDLPRFVTVSDISGVAPPGRAGRPGTDWSRPVQSGRESLEMWVCRLTGRP